MLKKILMVVLVFLWIHLWRMTNVVYAATCPDGQSSSDFGCIPDDPGGFAAKIYSIGLLFVGGAALLSIIYGAFLVLTSSGEADKLNKGKSYIVYALIGLFLAVGGYAFYRIIGTNIIQIPGFK